MSSRATPCVFLPLTYSLQYPPCRMTPSAVAKKEKPLRGLRGRARQRPCRLCEGKGAYDGARSFGPNSSCCHLYSVVSKSQVSFR